MIGICKAILPKSIRFFNPFTAGELGYFGISLRPRGETDGRLRAMPTAMAIEAA